MEDEKEVVVADEKEVEATELSTSSSKDKNNILSSLNLKLNESDEETDSESDDLENL